MDSSNMVRRVWTIFFLGTIPFSSSNLASDPNTLDAININLNIRATAKQGHNYEYLQQIRHKHKDNRKNVKYGNEANQFVKERKHLGDLLNLLKLYERDDQYGKKGSDFSSLSQNRHKNNDYFMNQEYGFKAIEFAKENQYLKDLLNFYGEDNQYGKRGCFHEDDIIYANDDPNNNINLIMVSDFGTHWSYCRQKCNSNKDCKFWTFIRKVQSTNYTQCSLMASYSNRTSESLHDEVISGNACREINELTYWENKRIQDYCKVSYMTLSEEEREIESKKRKLHKLPQDACEVAALSYNLTLKSIFVMTDNDDNGKLSTDEIDEYFKRVVVTWEILSEFWKYFFSDEKKSFELQYGHIDWMVDKLDNYTRKNFYSEYRILEFKVVWIYLHNITHMTTDEKENLRRRPEDEGFNSDGDGDEVFAWLGGKEMIDHCDIDGDNMIDFYECKLYMDKEFFRTCGSCHSTCEESDICDEKID